MATETLDFSFDVTGIDRPSLLAEAADLVDRRRTLLGAEGGFQGETDEGRLIRGLMDDIAKLPAYPEVYQITDETFLSAGFAQVPITVKQLAHDFTFYWIRIPIGLVPRHNWRFNRLELALFFNHDDPLPHRRPRAHAILPAKKFEDMFKSTAAVSLHLNDNLEFAAGLKPLTATSPVASFSGKAAVDASAMVKLGLTIGGEYCLRKASIYHNTPGMEWVFWRLDGTDILEEDSPVFIVIMQVPKDLARISIAAKLIAYRNFSYLTSSLQDAILTIPKTIKMFFEGGLPVWDALTAPWTIYQQPMH